MEKRRPRLSGLAAAALLAAVIAGGAVARLERRAVAVDLGTPRDLHGAAYAGSGACRRCHEDHYASWHRTFHRTMTADATETAVLGDFSGATLRHAGVVARMDRDPAGAFRMTFTPEAGGASRTAIVTRTVGSRRYQQYLTDVGGTTWRLPVAYSVEERRWFPMTAAFLFPSEPWEGSEPPAMGSGRRSRPAPDAIPSEPWEGSEPPAMGSGRRSRPAPDAIPSEPWEGSEPPAMGSGRRSRPAPDAIPDDAPATLDPSRPVFGGGVFDRHVARWNDNCVFCHNVAPDPGRDPASGAFRTRVAELGVACEACHGPGAEHARRNADPVRRYALHAGAGPDPTIVDPARLSPARAADVCGRCHGQRIADDVGPFLAHGDPFVPGDDLGLYTAPLWRETPLGGDREAFAARFWPDGTPRLTAYEYQGLLQSRCAQRGALTCTTCHGMHDGDPRGQIRAAFAGGGAASDGMCTGCHAPLASDEEKARHSRHDARGAGARCVACHMPRVVYGVLDVHRSHRIEIPRPARAAADAPPSGGDARPDACALCHADAPPALFAGDPLARAVAADGLGRAGAPLDAAARARRVGALLEVMAADRYPAVRHVAWRAVRRLAACCADYDPSAVPAARAAAVASARARLGGLATAPAAADVARLRAGAPTLDLEIGE